MWYKRSAHKRFSQNGDPCVTRHTIPQPVLFPDLFATPLVATFDQEHASSDGALSCSRRLSVCTAWSRRSPGVWPTNAHRGRFGTRLRT